MQYSSPEHLQLIDDVRKLVEDTPGLGWAAWPNGDFMCFSRAMERYTGATEQQLTAKDEGGEFSWKGAVTPEDYEVLSHAWLDAVKSGNDFEVTHKNQGASGGFRWLRSVAKAKRDCNGSIIFWLGTSIDIHDAVSSLEQSQASEARLQELVDTIPGLVWTFDENGEPQYYNKRLEEWGGQKISDIQAASSGSLSDVVGACIHPDDLADVKNTMGASIESGRPWLARFRQRRADGEWRWMEGRMEALRDDTGRILKWYGLELDIDHEVRADEALREVNEKLAKAAQFAGMAELSASIAHELSQPLASMLASADACHRWLSRSTPNVERARASAENGLRDAKVASEVVRKIRMLFRNDVEERRAHDMNAILLAVSKIVGSELAFKGIDLVLESDPSIALAYVDPLPIQQVLINLVKNASEAISSRSAATKTIVARTLRQNDEIVVEVEDFALGFADVEKAFVPFFTTKETGMGMGLSISRSILVAQEGRLWARNTDQGAIVAFAVKSHRGESQPHP